MIESENTPLFTLNMGDQQGGRGWGFNGFLAGLESKLDTILAEDQANAKANAEAQAAKKALADKQAAERAKLGAHSPV